MRLWDAQTGALLRTLRHAPRVRCAAFSVSGREVLTGGDDHFARVWDVETGRELRSRKHPAAVYRLEVGGDKVLTVASLHKGEEPREHPDPEFPEWQLSRSVAYLWDASTGRDVIEPERVITWPAAIPEVSWLRPAAISPDGTKLATSRPPAGITIWDAATGEPLAHAPTSATRSGDPETGIVSHVVFTPDSRKFLTAGSEFPPRLWDVASGESEVLTSDRWGWNPDAATFAPNGRRVLLTVPGGAAVVDLPSSALLLKTEPKGVASLPAAAFSPDGDFAVIGFAEEKSTAVVDVRN